MGDPRANDLPDLERLSRNLRLAEAQATRQFRSNYPTPTDNIILLVQGLGTPKSDPLYNTLKKRLRRISNSSLHVYSYAGPHRPRYGVSDTFQQSQALLQSHHLEEYFGRLWAQRRTTRIALVGYSMGGPVLCHFLCNLGEDDIPKFQNAIACVVLMGAPIAPDSLQEVLEPKARPSLRRLLSRYQGSAEILYTRFPQSVQFIGQNDQIADLVRSGIQLAGRKLNYTIPPVGVAQVNHYRLPEHMDAMDAVRIIIEGSMKQGFDVSARQCKFA